MRIRFDSLDRFEIPKMYLCNPGAVHNDGTISRVVGCLSGTSDEELVINFNALSELNFRIYKYYTDNEEENVFLNNLFRSVLNRRLIFVDGVGFFVITSIKDGTEDDMHYKDVRAQSCDVEIQRKMLTYIEDGTYKFTDLLEKTVSTLPLWTIGHIDEDVANKYRTFNDVSDELNTLTFMMENMQDAYECIIVFDIINRTIDVYDQWNYVRETDIHITRHDVINSIEISEDSEDLYTAIRVYGQDNLTIAPVNPLGSNTIYNFSYYLSWMTDSLREKVLSWQDSISSVQNQYYDLNLRYYDTMTEQNECDSEMKRLKLQIDMYSRCRDNIVASNGTDNVEKYNEVIVENGGSAITISEEISDMLNQIDVLISEAHGLYDSYSQRYKDATDSLARLNNDISEIVDSVSISTYFTEEEYGELGNYIFEGSYTDEYITVTDIMSYSEKFQQMNVLYNRAMGQLDKVSVPTQEFTVDVENFIFAKEFASWSEQLETGCIINVELDDCDNAMLFLSNMVINYYDKTLSMTFGNRFNKYDPKSVFDDALGDIKKTANTLDYIKDVIYPIKNGEFNEMKEAIETSRTLTMQDALSSENQEFVLDGSGYTGRQIMDNGMFDPRQVKLTNKNIVFTDDAWETCKVALGAFLLNDGETAYGINAETIIGQLVMGNNLRILDKDGNDLLTVMDGKIQMSVRDVQNGVEELSELIQGKDGIMIRVKSLEDNRDVNSVTTTAGYTFDSNGLTIYKDGEEIKCLIDNTGMYVSRGIDTDSDDILIANNIGVEAINLTAKQYLTIGGNSRFESYNNGNDDMRTGCFFVGGYATASATYSTGGDD